MSTIISVVYASAPDDEVIIPALVIELPGVDPIRVCGDYVDQELGVDGEMFTFQATAISVALPSKNDSGQQALNFGVAGIDDVVQRAVEIALESGQVIPITLYQYLESDKTTPAEAPIRMELVGGMLRSGESVFESSYYDLLNTAWPRERYTAKNSPGLKYQ